MNKTFATIAAAALMLAAAVPSAQATSDPFVAFPAGPPSVVGGAGCAASVGDIVVPGPILDNTGDEVIALYTVTATEEQFVVTATVTDESLPWARIWDTAAVSPERSESISWPVAVCPVEVAEPVQPPVVEPVTPEPVVTPPVTVAPPVEAAPPAVVDVAPVEQPVAPVAPVAAEPQQVAVMPVGGADTGVRVDR